MRKSSQTAYGKLLKELSSINQRLECLEDEVKEIKGKEDERLLRSLLMSGLSLIGMRVECGDNEKRIREKLECIEKSQPAILTMLEEMSKKSRERHIRAKALTFFSITAAGAIGAIVTWQMEHGVNVVLIIVTLLVLGIVGAYDLINETKKES